MPISLDSDRFLRRACSACDREFKVLYTDDENEETELARLRAENQALKAGARKGISLRVSDKGGVSVYGLGRFPVTLYKEQWLKLLDVASGRVLGAQTLKGAKSEPLCLAISPDGKVLAAGCADGAVRLWDFVLPAEQKPGRGREP